MASPKTKFETFHDGVVSLWVLNDNGLPELRLKDIRFQNRMVGAQRNYLAQQAGITIKKLIRIPVKSPRVIQPGMFAVIGGEQYQIETAQTVPDTIPRSTDLTLVQPEMLLPFDPQEAGAGGRI